MHTSGKVYDFIIFRRLADLTRSIYHGGITIEQAKGRQNLCYGIFAIKFKQLQTLDNTEKYFIEEKRLLMHLRMVFFHYLKNLKDGQKNKLIKNLTKRNEQKMM